MENFDDIYRWKPPNGFNDSVPAAIDAICFSLRLPSKVRARAHEVFRKNKEIIIAAGSDVGGSAAVAVAILSLQMREECRIRTIGKVFDISLSSITSRIYKVLKSRNIEVKYSIQELDRIIPVQYPILVQ